MSIVSVLSPLSLPLTLSSYVCHNRVPLIYLSLYLPLYIISPSAFPIFNSSQTIALLWYTKRRRDRVWESVWTSLYTGQSMFYWNVRFWEPWKEFKCLIKVKDIVTRHMLKECDILTKIIIMEENRNTVYIVFKYFVKIFFVSWRKMTDTFSVAIGILSFKSHKICNLVTPQQQAVRMKSNGNSLKTVMLLHCNLFYRATTFWCWIIL